MKKMIFRKNPFGGGTVVYLNEPIHNDNDPHYITGYFKNTVGNELDFVKLETLTSLQQKGYDYELTSFEKSLFSDFTEELEEILKEEKERVKNELGYVDYIE